MSFSPMLNLDAARLSIARRLREESRLAPRRHGDVEARFEPSWQALALLKLTEQCKAR